MTKYFVQALVNDLTKVLASMTFLSYVYFLSLSFFTPNYFDHFLMLDHSIFLLLLVNGLFGSSWIAYDYAENKQIDLSSSFDIDSDYRQNFLNGFCRAFVAIQVIEIMLAGTVIWYHQSLTL